MGDQNLRIDWFDGTVIENRRPNPPRSTNFDETKASTSEKPQNHEKKAIGYRKLYEISQMEPPTLNLELESRPGFWLLFTTDLSDDYIVLIIKTLSCLYKSLDHNDSSKLIKLLETKFMKSEFFNTLDKYLKNLPSVRFSQKSRNSQLWDDVDKFFCNLGEFYCGIFSFYKGQKEYLQVLHELIETTVTSAVGVAENHSETISISFYNNIKKLKLHLDKALKENNTQKIEKNERENSAHSAQTSSSIDTSKNFDEFYYKNMSVFPQSIDFSGIEMLDHITPNIINGAYRSVEHYLDVQFKLLREDCFRPLVEGIRQYIRDNTTSARSDIRIYRKVLITDMQIISNRVGYIVDLTLSEDDLNTYKDAKIFMNGALLLFTSENFKTITCATVLSGLNKKKIGVAFRRVLSNDVFSRAFVMVESEVYFEPYHRVLNVLQNADMSVLPMMKYIVYAEKHIYQPAYLKIDTVYCTPAHNGVNKETRFEVLQSSWPEEGKFGLDKSQMEAFKFALTKEFVVIQGPPGTGKTFLGTKIAGMLLHNLSFKESPMLIICATNHALDQFLEGILKYTDSVVRLGGQSKSDTMSKYNINKLAIPKVFSKMYYEKKKELKNVYEEIKLVSMRHERCSNGILSYDVIKKYTHLFNLAYESDFLNWLFGGKQGETICDVTGSDDICLSDDILRTAIERMKNNIKTIENMASTSIKSFENSVKYEEIIRKYKEKIQQCLKWREELRKMMRNRHKLVKPRVDCNMYDMTKEERWALYFEAVKEIKEILILKKRDLYAKCLSITKELEKLNDVTDCEKLKNVKVVGMTTTKAAGRHDLLKRLKCFVVIVEEAAEVLETHILAALTKECKHLILIGDHQQLRPTSAHYILGKKFNLEVSLFERMVRNGVHSKTLTTQRRMRKEIMDLLVPTIYKDLVCHPDVLLYPDVRCMKDNLYFFTHNFYEDAENVVSCTNEFEAKWCVSLANYFIKSNYMPDEVTILATYSAQVSLITKLSTKYELLKDVHITTVDNFQGEESRIVILSLVRSNKGKSIGFLAEANRVCVALSRAKEGLYIIGNMTCLETSPIWREIRDKLEKREAIGSVFRLYFDDNGDAKYLDETTGKSNVHSLIYSAETSPLLDVQLPQGSSRLKSHNLYAHILFGIFIVYILGNIFYKLIKWTK